MLDDERLKNPDQPFDYFEELLRRIQDILERTQPFFAKFVSQFTIDDRPFP